MKNKAIFFDFDGTLVVTEHLHINAWKTFLQQNKISQNFLDFEKLIGVSDQEIAQIIKKQGVTKQGCSQLCAQKNVIFDELLKKGITSPLGRNDFLTKVTKNHLLAIVSSGIRNDITKILSQEKIEPFFDFIVSYEDTKQHKPAPAPYLLAIEKSNVGLCDVIAIEDSPPGANAALNAGIINVFVLNTSSLPHHVFPKIPIFENYNELERTIL